MNEEVRIKVLEEEMKTIKNEFDQILIEVRMVIMDAQSPIKIYEKHRAEELNAALEQTQERG